MKFYIYCYLSQNDQTWTDLNLKLTWIITSEDSFKKEGILSRAHMKASVFKKPRAEPIKDNLKDDKSRCWRKAGSGGDREVSTDVLECMGLSTHRGKRKKASEAKAHRARAWWWARLEILLGPEKK